MAIMDLRAAERVAAQLLALGHAARAYPNKGYGHHVVVTGTNKGVPFRYRIQEDGATVERAISDLAAGLTGASDDFFEGVNTTETTGLR